MGYGMLNLGSLLLGLLAWVLPVINLVRRDKTKNKSWVALSVASISACAISLYLQILYQNHLVKIEDWSALMDTSNAVALVSAILLSVTVILNIIVLTADIRRRNHGR